jgi:hypothetical protein
VLAKARGGLVKGFLAGAARVVAVILEKAPDRRPSPFREATGAVLLGKRCHAWILSGPAWLS